MPPPLKLWRAPQTKVVRLTATHVLVYYRETLVAKRSGRTVRLHAAHSQTAIDRINQFAAEFCSGAFSVTQNAGAWCVHTALRTFPLQDGIQFEI